MIAISIKLPRQENIYRSLLLPFYASFLPSFWVDVRTTGVHIRCAFQRSMIYDFRDISNVSGWGGLTACESETRKNEGNSSR